MATRAPRPQQERIILTPADEEIIADVIQRKKNIFLHGPGGTGKTTLISEITKRFEAAHGNDSIENENLVVSAMTGAASLHLRGGTTVHRFAGIFKGDGDKDELYKTAKMFPKTVKRWRSVRLLIIDEISMMGASLFDKLEYIAKKIRNCPERPFGGIQLVICGDLLQLPPINDKWIFFSECWDNMNFKFCNLTKQRRYKDEAYFNLLLRVRSGIKHPDDMEILREREREYNNLELASSVDNLKVKPTILYSRRMDVDYYNLTELDKLPFEEVTFMSLDDLDFKHRGDDNDKTRKHYKNLLDDAIPEKITLKTGAQVMLRYNLDPQAGLVNGSRGVVLNIEKETGMVEVKFMNGTISKIGKWSWDIKNKEVIASRLQIPLTLAWACTVHKSQGATIDCVICDLGPSIFANAQAYVALSRVRNIEGLYLSEFEMKSIKADQEALAFLKSQNAEYRAETIEIEDEVASEEIEDEVSTEEIVPSLPSYDEHIRKSRIPTEIEFIDD